MLSNLAAYAGIGSFLVSIVALVWTFFNSRETTRNSGVISNHDTIIREHQSVIQKIKGNNNIVSGRDVTVNSKDS